MTRPAFAGFLAARNGAAAIEFALILPFLLAVIGGLIDFGLAFFDRCALAAAVTAGSQYAFSQGQLNQTALYQDVQSKVQNALSLTGALVNATPPTLHCVSRNTASNPPTTSFNSQTITAGQTCLSGNLPGTYMVITATYTYTPLTPLYGSLASTVLQETAYVRLF
jgi:Flp pilus assembly protein TadG